MNNIYNDKKDLNIILNLIDKKNFFEAKVLVKKLMKGSGLSAVLKNIEGYCNNELGNTNLAIQCFEEAIKLDKLYKHAYFNLGLTYQNKENYHKAAQYYSSALDIDSGYYQANLNLAYCYKQLKFFDDSINFYKKAIDLKPTLPDAYNNLGLVYLAQKKFQSALNCFKKTLEISPNMKAVYNNIGLTFINLKNYPEAILNFKKVIDSNLNNLNFSNYEVYNNIALALYHCGKYHEAFKFCNKALDDNVNFIKGYWVLSLIQKKLGNYKESLEAAQKCIVLNKNFYPVYTQLINLYCETCQHEKASDLINNILNLKKEQYETFDSEDIQVSIFYYNYLSNFQNDKYIKLVEILKNNFFKQQNTQTHNIIKNEKVKIGFLSADFKEHAVSLQLIDVFKELHKFSDIELYAYSNWHIEDHITQSLKSSFTSFKKVFDISDFELINLIRSDNIDVLIDLSGHTAGNRLTIFNTRLAKLHITWAGYLASTQIPNMDYIIADNFTVPAEQEKNYSEKIIRLTSWSVLGKIDNVVVSNFSPCNSNNFITFGSFNNIAKIHIDVIKLWSKILTNLKNSKIFLKNFQFDSLELRNIIKKKFLEFGVLEKNIILEGNSKRIDLLNCYNKIDIALDTFPYGGGTTSLEAASMCVPILTRTGNSFLSRCGESVNMNLGLSDWVCKDDNEYFEKALKFSNKEFLNSTKFKLKRDKNNFPIFNSKNLAKELVTSIKAILDKKSN